MQLVFLHGPPASGKLTVARELAAITGFQVFHNHATVDVLLPIFEFGSPPFVELRERIWLDVMGAAARANIAGLIFTFVPERSVRTTFVPELTARVRDAGGTIHFVRLQCAEEEVERRLSNPSRREFQKLQSADLFRSLRDSGAFEVPAPPVDLVLDTLEISPSETAQKIVERFKLRK